MYEIFFKLSFCKNIRVFSGSVGEFYKNLVGHDVGFFEQLIIGIGSKDSDITLFRTIVRAFLDSKNYSPGKEKIHGVI